MTPVQKINRAISTHSYWRHYLRLIDATGQSRLTVEAVRSAEACEFGRFLRELPTTTRFGEHRKRVRELHAEFHRAAANTLAAALEGQSEKTLDALSMGGEFAQALALFLAALRHWRLDEEIAAREATTPTGHRTAADAGIDVTTDRPRRT